MDRIPAASLKRGVGPSSTDRRLPSTAVSDLENSGLTAESSGEVIRTKPQSSADISGRHDATPALQLFLAAPATPDGGPDGSSLVARLCADSIRVYRKVVRQLLSRSDVSSDERRSYISLQRSYSRLKLWSNGYGISTGKLDDLFAKSQKLRHATLRSLTSISKTLVYRLLLLSEITSETDSRDFGENVQRLKRLVEAAEGDLCEDDSSTDSASDYGSDSIEDVCADLRTDTACLMELDPLFKNPVLDLDCEESVPVIALQHWAPHKAYSDKISTRFPRASELLISRLGQANYERYLRCQQDRDRHASAIDETDTVEPQREPRKEEADAAPSLFHDSGLGTSIPTLSSYAETVMTYSAGEGRSVRIPQLPESAKAGMPFACIACGRWVRVLTNSAWKRHIYEDLRPWLCLDGTCSYADKVFTSRQDWVTHLALDHNLEPEWGSFDCPLCLSDTGEGRISITKHLGGHLEEISLSSLPPDPDFDPASDGRGSDRDESADAEAEDGSETPGECIGHTIHTISHEQFMKSLAAFTNSRQLHLNPQILTADRILSLSDLFFAVRDADRNRRVSERDFWNWASREFGFLEPQVPTAPMQIRELFARYFLKFGEYQVNHYQGKCICGTTELEGITELEGTIIVCDGCNKWQHFACYYPDGIISNGHLCVDCKPRPLDVQRAVQLRTTQFPVSTGSESATKPGDSNASIPALGAASSSGPDEALETEAVRAPQPPYAYWSVSECDDFPALLRSFGTDWPSIAIHMQTKTAMMVEKYYIHHSRSDKPEWEAIATEADRQRIKGQKRPPPPKPPRPLPRGGFDPLRLYRESLIKLEEAKIPRLLASGKKSNASLAAESPLPSVLAHLDKEVEKYERLAEAERARISAGGHKNNVDTSGAAEPPPLSTQADTEDNDEQFLHELERALASDGDYESDVSEEE